MRNLPGPIARTTAIIQTENPMPTYIWTGRDKLGNPVIREIRHDTTESSKAVLVAEGCTDLKLIQDEVMDAAGADFAKECTVLGEEAKQTILEKRVEAMDKPPATFFRVLFDGLSGSKGVLLVMVVLGAFQAYRGHTIAAAVILFAVCAWIVFVIGVGIPSVYYAKLVKAADWARWTEVLEIVDKLRKLRRIHFIKVPIPELMRFRARALAGLGDLETALREYKQCEGQPGCSGWLYKAHVAGIYDTARQYDQALELNRQAISENPLSTLYLDLANRLLRYKRDPSGARGALAEAEKSTLAEIGKPFRLRCLGMLAYLEGDLIAAKRELEACLELMLKTPHVPFRDGHISVARAYLTCVLVGLGEKSAAQEAFSKAKEYLIATDEASLIAECRQALQTK